MTLDLFLTLCVIVIAALYLIRTLRRQKNGSGGCSCGSGGSCCGGGNSQSSGGCCQGQHH